MHLEVRLASVADLCVLHPDCLPRIRGILANPEGSSALPLANAPANGASPPTATAQRRRPSQPCSLSISLSFDRVVQIESRVFCNIKLSEKDFPSSALGGDLQITAAKIRRPVDIREALLLSLPTDLIDSTVKIRLWQHFEGGGPKTAAVGGPNGGARPTSVCIGIAKVPLSDLIVRSGGCVVSLTAKKAVVDACILANNDFDKTMAYFSLVEGHGSPIKSQTPGASPDRLIKTGALSIVACAILFDRMPQGTLFCMAPLPQNAQSNQQGVSDMINLNSVVVDNRKKRDEEAATPAHRLEASARRIARENGLVISAKRHRREFSDQSNLDEAPHLGVEEMLSPVTGRDFQVIISRIALSSPQTRLLLLPIAVCVDVLVRAVDAVTWRRPLKTLLLLICFNLAFFAEICNIALSIVMCVIVITAGRSALAYSLVDESSPSTDPFLTNSDAVVFSRHSATFNSLVRFRIWLRQGLQAEAFFEIAIVLQMLRRHSFTAQIVLLAFSAAFAVLSELAFFMLVIATIFVFVPLRLRYGPKLLPIISAARREKMKSFSAHQSGRHGGASLIDAAPSTATVEVAAPASSFRSLCSCIRPVWKPSDIFSRPFVVTGVAKITVGAAMDITASAPSTLLKTSSLSSILARRSKSLASPMKGGVEQDVHSPPKRKKIKAKPKAMERDDPPLSTKKHDERKRPLKAGAAPPTTSSVETPRSNVSSHPGLGSTRTFNELHLVQPEIIISNDDHAEDDPGLQEPASRRNSVMKRRSPHGAENAVPPLDLGSVGTTNSGSYNESSRMLRKQQSSAYWSPVQLHDESQSSSPTKNRSPVDIFVQTLAKDSQSKSGADSYFPQLPAAAPTNEGPSSGSPGGSRVPLTAQVDIPAADDRNKPSGSPIGALRSAPQQLYCALVEISLRDAPLGSQQAPNLSTASDGNGGTSRTSTPRSLSSAIGQLGYHAGADMILGKILALYRLSEQAPAAPPAPPPAPVPSMSMFPLNALTSVLTSQPGPTPQQLQYQLQCQQYHQQLMAHNQQYFEEASNLLQLLRRQVVRCEALVTPSPPRYDFPTALLYRAESRVKGACVVECVANDPATASILTTGKRDTIMLGKLPEDSSVDSVMRIRALLSLMILQGTRMTVFAAKDKPRLSFVVPLGPNNLPLVSPKVSSCPPHLANALREAWEGWTEQSSSFDSSCAQSVTSPEMLNHVISQYIGYWKNLPYSPPFAAHHGATGSFQPTTGSATSISVSQESLMSPQHLAGGLRRADVSFRGRVKEDSSSVFHTAKMSVRPAYSAPLSADVNAASAADVAASRHLSGATRAAGASPRIYMPTKSTLGVTGSSGGTASPQRSMRKVLSQHPSRSTPPQAADFHFVPHTVSEGEESAQSARMNKRPLFSPDAPARHVPVG
jgi:hypothetical protein